MLCEILSAAPAISAIAASCAFIAAVYFNRRSEVRVVRPVLVFVDKQDAWYICNIGNGPALDVVVVKHAEKRPWEEPVRVPPLGKDAQFKLHWIDKDVYALGAMYGSFDGLDYTSVCVDDLTTIKVGRRLKYTGEIVREWELRDDSPA